MEEEKENGKKRKEKNRRGNELVKRENDFSLSLSVSLLLCAKSKGN